LVGGDTVNAVSLTQPNETKHVLPSELYAQRSDIEKKNSLAGTSAQGNDKNDKRVVSVTTPLFERLDMGLKARSPVVIEKIPTVTRKCLLCDGG